MKKNLDHSVLPTAEEIKLYQEGKLSPGRTHEIELLAEENPMLGDALEGYAALPLFGAVPGVTAAVSQQASSGILTGSKGLAAAAKSGTAWWHLNGWVIGVGVGISAALIAVVVSKSSDSTTEQQSIAKNQINAQVEVTASNVEENADYSIEKDIQQPQENKVLVTSSADKESTANKINTNGSESLMEASSQLYSPSESIEALPSKEVVGGIVYQNDNLASSDDVSRLKLNNSALVAITMVTLQHHRIADYSDLRSKNWEPLKLEEIGLSANYAGYENKHAEIQNSSVVVSIPYLKYIEQCIIAYDNQEYKFAIKGFQNVLKQYNDDINAQFYCAMSYYHHEQPVLALELLEKAEKNTITAFREEIQFYKAKCLKMLNRTDESTALFKQIAAKSGFYKTQAQKELND